MATLHLELIQEEVVASVVSLVLEEGVAEVLIEVRRISHPGGGRLEVLTLDGPALLVRSVAVGEVVVRIVVHPVDIVSLGGISATKEHPQTEQAGQEQRRAASKHV